MDLIFGGNNVKEFFKKNKGVVYFLVGVVIFLIGGIIVVDSQQTFTQKEGLYNLLEWVGLYNLTFIMGIVWIEISLNA